MGLVWRNGASLSIERRFQRGPIGQGSAPRPGDGRGEPLGAAIAEREVKGRFGELELSTEPPSRSTRAYSASPGTQASAASAVRRSSVDASAGASSSSR